MKEILNVIHNTIYQFIDVCNDNEEVPMSDKDKLLLEVNKAICNNLKALEQQSCNTPRNDLAETSQDCINREAVLEQIDDWRKNEFLGVTNPLHYLRKRISSLPSVAPQLKTGRWMRWYKVIESADGKSTDYIPHCKCSECGTEYEPHSSQFVKYCNECGAKMGVEDETDN